MSSEPCLKGTCCSWGHAREGSAMSTDEPRYPPPYPGYPQYQQEPKTSGKAVASMVTGITAVIIPCVGLVLGIIAIVLAAKARREIRQTGEKGDGLAITGLVTGIIGCVWNGFFVLALAVSTLGNS